MELILILDAETRLITPIDPEGTERPQNPDTLHAEVKCYQLSHDYLIGPLRAWLTRKQWESRRGRAELRLKERTALLRNLPGYRHLPGYAEWLSIIFFSARHLWTEERNVVMRTTLYHLPLTIIIFAVSWWLSNIFNPA